VVQRTQQGQVETGPGVVSRELRDEIGIEIEADALVKS
jgi:hypothetical protein